jgi:tRNA threonylcarbamoyladenosine biosynthesis protein TsaB
MILFIDTSDFNNLHFALVPPDEKIKVEQLSKTVAYNENHKTLELLQKFLKKQKTQLKQVKKIVVCSGPGSFTGIRVGVALAQAMGFALNIPVVAIKKTKVPKNLGDLRKLKASQHIVLHYGKKPNITKSKRKSHI